MYSLIIDSATKVLYISLVENNKKILDEYYIEGNKDHAKNIVSKVDEILKNNNLKANDLDEVVVGVGPGSYTGVRMGVTIGKMLAVFLNVPLYKISTLKLMASAYEGIVLAAIDARRGNSFGAIIDTINDKYKLEEGMYETNNLLNMDYEFNVSDSINKVNPFYALKSKEIVKEPHLLVPNYLRETEAERNIHD